jgi:hypothetical protein
MILAQTVEDSSGNNYYGTYVHTTNDVTPGPFGCDTGIGTTQFNGTNSVAAPYTYNSSNPDPFTIGVAFKTTTSGPIMELDDGSTYDRTLYVGTDGKLYFGVDPSGTQETINSSAIVDDGNWHYATAELSGAGMVLYLDGIEVASNPSITTAANNAGIWLIGVQATSWPNLTNSDFDGDISQVTVYSSTLSGGTISSLSSYILGTGSGGSSSNVVPGVGSEEAFQVQDPSGNSVLDVDNSNDKVYIGPNSTTLPVQLYVGQNSTSYSAVTDGHGYTSVATSGDYAYVTDSTGNEILVYDIATNPESPALVNTEFADDPTSITIDGNYAYVVEGGSGNEFIEIYSLVDNDLEALTSFVQDLPGDNVSIAINGNYAYVTSGYEYPGGSMIYNIEVWDLDDHIQPQQVTFYTSGIDYPVDIAYSNGYVYVVDSGADEVDVYATSNNGNLSYVGDFSTDLTDPVSITISGTLAYVTNDNGSSSNVVVFNVDNPTDSIPLVTDITGLNDPSSVTISGEIAYIANTGAGDVIAYNMTSLSVGATISTSLSEPVQSATSGNYLYIADANDGLVTESQGGAYIQSLEAGSTETSTLQVNGNASVANDVTIGNDLTVNGQTSISSSLNVGGDTVISDANSPMALEVMGGDLTNNVLNVNTDDAQVTIGGDSNYGYDYQVLGDESAQLYVGGLGSYQATKYAQGGLFDITSEVVSGNYEYVLDGYHNAMYVFNISTPSSPVEVGFTSTDIVNPTSVAVSGNYAYVTTVPSYGGTGSLVVFNVSNPASPTEVMSTSSNLSSPYDIVTSGSYAYISDNTNGLVIYNLTNPSAPTWSATINTNLSDPGDLVVSGNYVYVTDRGNDNVVIYNVTTPGLPSYSAALTNLNLKNPSDVAVSGNYAYVTDYNNGLFVFNVTTPGSPSYVTTNNTGLDLSYGIAISGSYAYIASNGNSSLVEYNISNPSLPTETVSSSSGLSYPQAITVSGSYAYVQDEDQTVIFNIATPGLLNNIGAVDGWLGNITAESVENNYDYALVPSSNQLVVFNYNVANDTNNSSEYAFETALTTSGLNDPVAIATSSDYAYVASYGNNSLVVFNISNPENPVEVGTVTTGGGSEPDSIIISGSYAYVTAKGTHSLEVFNISNPGSPVEVGSTTSGLTNPDNLATFNGYVYVTDASGAVVTFNVTDPVNPTKVNTTSTDLADPDGIAIAGGYAYVVDYTNDSLLIYDLSNAAFPSLIANDTSASLYEPSTVVAAGNYVYVSNPSSSGIEVIDVSNPYELFNVDSFGYSYVAPNTIAISGNEAYVAYSPYDGGGWIETYSIGGAYIQSLDTGTTQTGSLQVNGSSNVNGDASIAGSVSVSGSFQALGASNLGGLTINGLNIPLAPTVNATPGTGSTSYSYVVSAFNSSGSTAASSSGGTLLGGATLSSTVYNTIAWPAVSGATGYNIYRSLGTGGTGYLGTEYTVAPNPTTPTSFNMVGTTATVTYTGLLPSNITAGSGVTLSGFTSSSINGTYVVTATTTTTFQVVIPGGPYTESVMGTVSSAPYFVDNGVIGGVPSPTSNSAGNLSVGGTALFQNTNNSTTAFQVQTANGTDVLNIDTTDQRIDVGMNGTPTAQLYVSGSVPSVATGSVTTGASSQPQSVYVSGNYAYVADTGGNNLQIFNISNPSSPVSISSVPTGSAPISVYVEGRYAYVANWTSGTLQIIDVSNPTSPVVIGSVNTGTNPISVYVQGNYAYLVNNGTPSLQIFDVSNPTNPVSAGSVATAANPLSLYVSGRYAYEVTSNGGTNEFQIFDVSNPSSPVMAGQIATGGDPNAVYVSGSYAYIANWGSGTLQVYNVSNPTIPTPTGSVSDGGGPTNLFVQGRYAYVYNINNNTLQTFDISNPATPASVGSVNITAGNSTYSVGLFVQGRYAYTVDNTGITLQIFNLGGAYIQQLQAGGTETGSLQVDGNSVLTGDISIQGGLFVSSNSEFSGNVGISGQLLIENQANSTTALQVKNAAGTSLLTVDTTDDAVTINSNSFGLSSNVRGINVSVPASATSLSVTFGTAYSNSTYAVFCTPNFDSTCYVSNKTDSGFQLNFGTAAPGGGTGTVDWLVVE